MKCDEKARYYSKALAKEVIDRVMRERQIQLRTYRCDYCGNLHLTHWKDATHPWAMSPERVVETWLKVGMKAVQACIDRGSISKSTLSKVIKMIEQDQKIPALWKLAELGTLRDAWLKLNS